MSTTARILVTLGATLGLLVGIVLVGSRHVTPEVVPPARPAPALAPPAKAAAKPMVGVIIADHSLDLSPGVDGILKKIVVHVGDRVAENDVVAELDNGAALEKRAVARAQLERSNATLQHARALLAGVRARYEPSQHMSPEVLSKADLAVLHAELKAAESDVSAAQADVEEKKALLANAERTLSYVKVQAPFEGLVVERLRGIGSQVGPGTPILRLVAASELTVRFGIPELMAGQVVPGTKLSVDVPAVPIRLPAVVMRVSPTVDAASRMLTGEARLEGTGLLSLRSGLTAVVVLSP